MKGFIARALSAVVLAGGFAAMGCQTTRESGVGGFYDRCWPQRYNHAARESVVDGFAPQVQNGHVLDQTIWNYHFESGTDKLTPGGMAKLDSLSRRRPSPDANLFLATARDLAYDPADSDKLGENRRDLDARRIAAIQKYLGAQMSGRPMNFIVQIHDPYPVNQPGTIAANNVRAYQSGGSASLGGGTTSGSAGGATSGQSGSGASSGQGSGSSGSSTSSSTATPTR
jgi:uncharacterized membrane protein YgcG